MELDNQLFLKPRMQQKNISRKDQKTKQRISFDSVEKKKYFATKPETLKTEKRLKKSFFSLSLEVSWVGKLTSQSLRPPKAFILNRTLGFV